MNHRQWIQSVLVGKKINQTRTITGMAMLAALYILLNMLTINLTPTLRIRFSFIALAMSCSLYGFLPNVIFCLVVDFLGFIAHPDGPYMPAFALVLMVKALIYSFFLYNQKVLVYKIILPQSLAVVIGHIKIILAQFFAVVIGHIKIILPQFLTVVIGHIKIILAQFFAVVIRNIKIILAQFLAVVIGNILLNPLILTFLYHTPYWLNFSERLLKNLVCFPIECLVLVLFLNLKDRLVKQTNFFSPGSRKNIETTVSYVLGEDAKKSLNTADYQDTKLGDVTNTPNNLDGDELKEKEVVNLTKENRSIVLTNKAGSGNESSDPTISSAEDDGSTQKSTEIAVAVFEAKEIPLNPSNTMVYYTKDGTTNQITAIEVNGENVDLSNVKVTVNTEAEPILDVLSLEIDSNGALLTVPTVGIASFNTAVSLIASGYGITTATGQAEVKAVENVTLNPAQSDKEG